MLTYQEQQRLNAETREPPACEFATVMYVFPDGLVLIFDGETVPTNKKYKYNKSIDFVSGQRVKVAKVSGTYVVEYPI